MECRVSSTCAESHSRRRRALDAHSIVDASVLFAQRAVVRDLPVLVVEPLYIYSSYILNTYCSPTSVLNAPDEV